MPPATAQRPQQAIREGIALRMAVLKDDLLHIQAGAGVVADSDPKAEHEECANKARALLRAAEESVSFASSRR